MTLRLNKRQKPSKVSSHRPHFHQPGAKFGQVCVERRRSRAAKEMIPLMEFQCGADQQKLNSSAKHTKAPAGNVGLAGEMERERKSGGRRAAAAVVVLGGLLDKQTARPQDERRIDRDRRPACSMLMPTATKQALY